MYDMYVHSCVSGWYMGAQACVWRSDGILASYIIWDYVQQAG